MDLITELPFGWQVIDDPGVGIYYVDHINRRTQFENPVLQARMGQNPQTQQLHPQQTGGYPVNMSYAPPPFQQGQYQQESPPRTGLRPPPPIPLQVQAGYGPTWPEGWTPDLVLARIGGDQVITQLKNFGTGFGFVLIGGDSPGELLVIKDIMANSPAEQDGILERDDVLVRVNDQIILMCPHQDVVQLIKSVQMGSVVEIEVRRNAQYPPLRGFPSGGFDQPMEPIGNRNQGIQYQEIALEIERGQFGFGFTITDGTDGQSIKSINDAERCLKLRVGDMLASINGQDVLHMVHQDVVNILKSCPKGAVCEFIVRREAQSEIPMHTKEEAHAGFQYREEISHHNNGSMDQQSPPPIPPHDYESIEILLHAKESGFGFAITGGAEEGSQVSIGRVIAGGAADLDGRLQIGDEITHVNNESVLGATHRDVISLIANSSINRSILLRVARPSMGTMQRIPQTGPRIVNLEKNQDESFGFVIQSNGMDGSIISRLLEDTPAMRCGELQLGDMIVQVNGEDVRGMTHQEVVSRIKASTYKIALTVLESGQDETLEGPQVPAQPSSPAQSHRFAVTQNQPTTQFQSMGGEPFPTGEDEEYNPRQEEEGDVFLIEIQKNEEGFGFSIHGGADVGLPLRVMKIAAGKAADRDGRLLANDEILEINGQDTQGMMHHDAINQIKYGGGSVKLVIRRSYGQEEFTNP